MMGAKTPLRLIHFSNETEEFFCANKTAGVNRKVRIISCFIIIGLEFKCTSSDDHFLRIYRDGVVGKDVTPSTKKTPHLFECFIACPDELKIPRLLIRSPGPQAGMN